MRLKPGRTKHLMMLLLCSAFVALGYFLLRQGEFFGWVCIAFFGLGIVVFPLAMLPGNGLTLLEDRMVVRSLFRTRAVYWKDVDTFFAHSVRGHNMVGWTYKPSYVAQSQGRAVAAMISGMEAALPETYGYSAAELAALLNRWLEAHASRPRP